MESIGIHIGIGTLTLSEEEVTDMYYERINLIEIVLKLMNKDRIPEVSPDSMAHTMRGILTYWKQDRLEDLLKRLEPLLD